MAQEMLTNWARERDQYGVPIVEGSWQRFEGDDISDEDAKRKLECEEKLKRACETARSQIEAIAFTLTWLMPHLNLHGYPPTRSLAGAVIDSNNDKSVEAEINLLNEIKHDALAYEAVLAHPSTAFLEHAVSGISDKLSRESSGRPPQGQLRIWGPTSHTEYDERFGFRCSAWRKCRPATDFEELRRRGEVSVEKLQSHCQERPRPSNWISLSGKGTWTLKQINEKYPDGSVSTRGMRVALVSTAKMERLGVLFDRSDMLVKTAGGKLYRAKTLEGVKFAWPIHYLAYGWIPVQCIVKTFTLTEFRKACTDRNIRPG
jgi:hypothetical protein